MDAKEAERIVIAKPVPSRPTTYSNFRSFSELLAGAINASPSCPCSETTVTAIRPKTVRFKPTEIKAPADRVISQAELSGAAVCSRSDTVDEVLKPESKSTVIYKPLAKVVSRTTFSLLANLGNSNFSLQQALSQVDAHVQPPNQYKYHFRSDLHQNLSSSQTGSQKATEPPNMALENTEDDKKYLPPAGNSDRSSYDGYNWRKYGQKQVKGSEYPRSYYKCTHPNCPVKKKVERSLDGQIAEVVYKGEHNHSKPQPPKRNASTSQGQGYVSDETGQGTNIPSWSSQISVRNNENLGGRLEYQKNYSGKASLSCDPAATGEINTGLGTPENSCGLQGDCEGGSKGLEAEDDEPKSKRRKLENEGSIPRVAEEPRITGKNAPTDSEIIGDGFRWRKYGQKVVKGNPYPRSYYRCTSLKCNVRKHVERAIDDPTAFIMTYEGKHNHEMPTKHTNPASESDSQAAISKDKV